MKMETRHLDEMRLNEGTEVRTGNNAKEFLLYSGNG